MDIKRTIQQAPWRTRRQQIGAVLLALVGVIMVFALYLSVASQATLTGREIQSLERNISLTREQNANLKTELARLLSYRSVQKRSDALGFSPATPEETHYILVPGYEEVRPINLTDTTTLNTNISSLPTAYSQSLFEWIDLQMHRGSSQ